MDKVFDIKETDQPDMFEVHLTTHGGGSYARRVSLTQLLQALPLNVIERFVYGYCAKNVIIGDE